MGKWYDTDSYINGFRHFISRRGHMKEISLDNGTNFTLTEKELREALKS